MHAISQEPEPCIYAQLEACMSEEEQDETDEELYPEIRLVPKDADKCKISSAAQSQLLPHSVCCKCATDTAVLCTVQAIFETLCECAALNPDTEEGAYVMYACSHCAWLLFWLLALGQV